jgi:hypothetical protein
LLASSLAMPACASISAVFSASAIVRQCSAQSRPALKSQNARVMMSCRLARSSSRSLRADSIAISCALA